MLLRPWTLFVALVSGTTGLRSEVLYTVTDLGVGFATGINNAGQVVGSSTGSSFLYSNGVRTDFRSLHAIAINGSGTITGSYLYLQPPFGSIQHAFLYSNGAITDLGALGGSSSGMAISENGQVTGSAKTASGIDAFLYSNGAIADLGTLGGRTSSGAGINDAGQVTGTAETASDYRRAFLYSNGVMTDLGTLGGNLSYGDAINNNGQVTGSAETSPGAWDAFLYSNGVMTDLGVGKLNDNDYSEGFGINSTGQVVGRFYADGLVYKPFLYSNGVVLDLTTVIDPGFRYLDYATGINDAGQIIVNSGSEAYLLTPVPEPDSWVLLGVGLLALRFLARPHHR